MQGNVFLPASASGLPGTRQSTSSFGTLDKSDLEDTAAVGELPGYLMDDADGGLRLTLKL